jgi:hypothetical protein
MRNRTDYCRQKTQRTGTEHIGDKYKNASASPSPRVGDSAPKLLDGRLRRRRQDAKIDPPLDAAQVLEPPPLLLRHAPAFVSGDLWTPSDLQLVGEAPQEVAPEAGAYIWLCVSVSAKKRRICPG